MKTEERRCMNCMEPLFEDHTCLKCGHLVDEPQLPLALPYETLLQGRYIVGRAQKYGSQGFTYIGYDKVLNNKIAIREYFPKTLCQRDINGLDSLTNQACYDLYCDYLKQFLTYSRTIARMRELTAVDHIYDIFEENGTAYTVSDWDEQVSLRYFIEKSGGHLDWNSARKLFMPVLSALSTLHENGIGHYGISLDSLSIMENGKMKLGDFCIEAVRREKGRLPADLVGGCAALEQYSQTEPFREATDVYGFTASLFYALTGALPEKAIKRKEDARLMIPTGILKELPPHVVTSMANGLQVYPQKRTQTFERLRAELSASPTITAVIEETQSIPKLTEDELRKIKASEHIKEPKEKHLLPAWVWILISAIVVLAAAMVIFFLFNFNGGESFNQSSEEFILTSSVEAESHISQERVFSSQTSEISEVVMTAPNLVGQNYSVVRASSAQQVLDYEVLSSRYVFSDQIPEGYIISQTPKAGESMIKGGTILVEISQGPYKRILPNVAGMSYEQAEKQLREQGFEVSYVYQSDSLEAGYVIGYQDQQAGNELQYGAHIVLIVSSGL